MMIIQALIKMGIKEIYLAGFDGFKGEDDYIYNYYELQVDNTDKNSIIKEILKIYSKDIKINFITPSLFGAKYEI